MTTIVRHGYIVMIAVAGIFIAVLGYVTFLYYNKQQDEKNRAITMHKEVLDMTTSDANESQTSVVVSI